MTQRLRVGWRGFRLRREFRHWLVFPADFRRNFGELYRARFNSDFNDLYIAGLVSTRGISAAGQNQDLRTIKILQLWTESWKTCFFSVLASLMLWYQFVVHTGLKANTNKIQTSRFTWFPKPGTSTEAADCILLEEWYKYSTQPNTTHKKPVFHSYTLFSQIFTCTHSHSCTHHTSLHTYFLHTQCTLPLSFLSSVFCISHTRLQEKGKHKYSGCKGEGGWWWRG